MGVIDYWIVRRLIDRHVSAVDDVTPTQEERALFERRAARLRKLLVAGTVVLFPIVGCSIGAAID
jgi:hypothetical protein